MSKTSISAKRKDDTASTVVSFDLPDNLAAMVTAYGEDIVYSKAKQAIVIDLQAMVRRAITPATDKDGKVTRAALGGTALQAEVDKWKPDNRTTVKKSATDKAKDAIAAMTPEEKQALLASLKSEVKA
jgi:hypothetical protein